MKRLRSTFAGVLILTSPAIGQVIKNEPLSIYVTWAAHDQLSDTVKLTEALSLKELDAVLKLKNEGAKMDYYLLDMYWFDKQGGYRYFDKKNWPNGHKAFFDQCKKNNLKLGLWLSPNVLGWSENMRWLDYQNEWSSSIGKEKLWHAMYTGTYFPHFMKTIEYWYGEGVTMFKLDFSAFWAAKEGDDKKYTKDQIIEMNKKVFLDSITAFRTRHPDAKFVGYNGYVDGGLDANKRPFIFDKRFLTIFDALFCGDPHPGEVPFLNTWRSVDVYSDQCMREFMFKGIPPAKIDNAQFMIGTTGTVHFRMKADWKPTLISALAKGSMFNTYYGNISLLNTEDMKWFTKTQKLYYSLSKTSAFGPPPYQVNDIIGYAAFNNDGKLLTIINSSQEVKSMIPTASLKGKRGKLLFADGGFKPIIESEKITLGPEQMAVIGYDGFTKDSYYLGENEEVITPSESKNLNIDFKQTGNKGMAETMIEAPTNIRLVFTLVDSLGVPILIKGGAAPKGKYMGDVFKIEASQATKKLPVKINYNLQMWGGLNWAVGEINKNDVLAGKLLNISFTVNNASFTSKIRLKAYALKY
jgi:hypothetical protein